MIKVSTGRSTRQAGTSSVRAMPIRLLLRLGPTDPGTRPRLSLLLLLLLLLFCFWPVVPALANILSSWWLCTGDAQLLSRPKIVGLDDRDVQAESAEADGQCWTGDDAQGSISTVNTGGSAIFCFCCFCFCCCCCCWTPTGSRCWWWK